MAQTPVGDTKIRAAFVGKAWNFVPSASDWGPVTLYPDGRFVQYGRPVQEGRYVVADGRFCLEYPASRTCYEVLKQADRYFLSDGPGRQFPVMLFPLTNRR